MTMKDQKSLFASRTFWLNVLGIAATPVLASTGAPFSTATVTVPVPSESSAARYFTLGSEHK
jgi:hypothetical protein